MKLEHSLTPYTKVNSKWIKALTVRLDIIELLEEDTDRTFSGIYHREIFFTPPPRVVKTKIYK